MEAGVRWPRSGSHHHGVGAECRDVVGEHRCVHLYTDVEPFEFAFVPLDEFGDLRAARLQARQTEGAAEFRPSLSERDAVPSFGRHACGLQSTGPTAHDQNGLGPRGRFEGVAAPFPLATHRWVHQARNPVVARTTPPAHLVARDAAANFIGSAGERLVHEVRVGDLTAHDAHHVGLPAGDHVVGVLRCAHLALGLHLGMAHRALQPLGVLHPEIVGVLEGGDDLVGVEVAAGAAGDVVHELAFVVPGHHLAQVVDAHRHRAGGVDAHGNTDDELVAHPGANALHDLSAEAQAILQRATPLVGSPVAPWQPELVDDGVVGGEQFHSVETAPLRAVGSIDEALDGLFDLRLAHRVASFGVVVRRQPRRRPGRLVAVVEVAVLADVVQLLQDHGSLGVHGIGDGTKSGDHGVVAGEEVASGEHRGGVHRHGLHHNHRRATPGALEVVAEVPSCGQTQLRHVGRMRTEHDAVAQREVAQLQRLCEVRMAGTHAHNVVAGGCAMI